MPGAAAFGRYARWYDAFNAGKDYRSEVRYLLGRLPPGANSPRRWLDVGCGTGGHVAALRAYGVDAIGADPSAAMVAEARARHPGVEFHVAGAQDLELARRFDVVSMLFHVLSYQPEDEGLVAGLRNLARMLEEGGALLFDFWHTGGVRADPPARRVREAAVEGTTMFRVALPRHDPASRRVEVQYEFREGAVDGPLVHAELHVLRHFSVPELDALLGEAGLEREACWRWMGDEALGPDDWYGLVRAGVRRTG